MYFGDESRHLESVTEKAAGVVLPNVGLAQASDSVPAGSKQCQVQRLVLLWPHVPIDKNNSLGEVRWRGNNAGKA